MGIQDTDVGIIAFDHESVTVAAAAIGLTSGTYLDAIYAELTLETAEIRMRVDGGNPSATVGHIVEVGDVITLEGTKQISQFKGYRTGGVSGVLKATYFH